MNTTDHDGTECEGCGEYSDRGYRVVGRQEPVPLCDGCAHDLTTKCPDCERRIFQVDGVRIYSTPELHCESCAAQHPALVRSRELDARLDEARGK